MSKSSEAKARYDAKNTKQYRLKLNLNTDTDIINKLADVDNMQGYIKELIRRDMKLSPFMRALLKKSTEGYEIISVFENSGKHLVRMANENSVITIKEVRKGCEISAEDGKILERFG